ncbi:hypothetical protein [Tardibacter chloracetimidivorans]|uniref:hypothetical protein n=1 Tax=Tardibacter chloracetimidivorans TaxID=1921510 RepID=UPI001D056E8D|nr:hypothetical protein [Tardibacter chloracetimidivorans]
MRDINVEQPSEMIVEAVAAPAIVDVECRLERLRQDMGEPIGARLFIQLPEGIEAGRQRVPPAQLTSSAWRCSVRTLLAVLPSSRKLTIGKLAAAAAASSGPGHSCWRTPSGAPSGIS